MTGLRFLACTQCETVYALAGDAVDCRRCGGRDFDVIDAETGASGYFSSAIAENE